MVIKYILFSSLKTYNVNITYLAIKKINKKIKINYNNPFEILWNLKTHPKD